MEYDLGCRNQMFTLLVMNLLSFIILQAKGTDLSTLIALFKENAVAIGGVGFICAGLAVLKKVVTNHEKTKEALLTYFVALIVWICIMSLL